MRRVGAPDLFPGDDRRGRARIACARRIGVRAAGVAGPGGERRPFPVEGGEAMNQGLPTLVVTGASGFLGRSFVEAAADRYRLFCIARRSDREAGIQRHENVRWISIDVGSLTCMKEATRTIRNNGGADFLLHLAGYYDFEMTDNPAYEETNVVGTRLVLEMARELGVQRFVFSSSLAVCDFLRSRGSITEESPPDAVFPYARSKRIAEQMIREASRSFPCSIVRLAPVFSDWCEYPPLYMLLETWLSRRWNARILAGSGATALPYLHVHDLNRLFFRILERSERLPGLGVYIASPRDSTSHLELYRAALRYDSGEKGRAPVRVPKPLAAAGLTLRWGLGRVLGSPPFERPWMIPYIDRRLQVDPSRTHRLLELEPAARHAIPRRLLFVIERRKHAPNEWTLRNERILRRVSHRPNLRIYCAMMEKRQAIVNRVLAKVYRECEERAFLRHYRQMNDGTLRSYLDLVLRILAASFRDRDSTLIRAYAHTVVSRRFDEGFTVEEILIMFRIFRDAVVAEILDRPDLERWEGEMRRTVSLFGQLLEDEIEDTFEELRERPRGEAGSRHPSAGSREGMEVEEIVRQIGELIGDAP
jgi:nucleoside-diphosphate-sugar epimerase